MIELMNCELMTRPTFKQAMESFRQCIPTIVEARIQEKEKQLKSALVQKMKAEGDAAQEEEVEEKRAPLKQKDLARQISEKYSQKESILSADGLESKDPLKVDLYVDTHYVDYMLSGVTGECMYEIFDLKRRTKDNTDTIQKLLESHENQSRWV